MSIPSDGSLRSVLHKLNNGDSLEKALSVTINDSIRISEFVSVLLANKEHLPSSDFQALCIKVCENSSVTESQKSDISNLVLRKDGVILPEWKSRTSALRKEFILTITNWLPDVDPEVIRGIIQLVKSQDALVLSCVMHEMKSIPAEERRELASFIAMVFDSVKLSSYVPTDVRDAIKELIPFIRGLPSSKKREFLGLMRSLLTRTSFLFLERLVVTVAQIVVVLKEESLIFFTTMSLQFVAGYSRLTAIEILKEAKIKGDSLNSVEECICIIFKNHADIRRDFYNAFKELLNKEISPNTYDLAKMISENYDAFLLSETDPLVQTAQLVTKWGYAYLESFLDKNPAATHDEIEETISNAFLDFQCFKNVSEDPLPHLLAQYLPEEQRSIMVEKIPLLFLVFTDLSKKIKIIDCVAALPKMQRFLFCGLLVNLDFSGLSEIESLSLIEQCRVMVTSTVGESANTRVDILGTIPVVLNLIPELSEKIELLNYIVNLPIGSRSHVLDLLMSIGFMPSFTRSFVLEQCKAITTLTTDESIWKAIIANVDLISDDAQLKMVALLAFQRNSEDITAACECIESLSQFSEVVFDSLSFISPLKKLAALEILKNAKVIEEFQNDLGKCLQLIFLEDSTIRDASYVYLQVMLISETNPTRIHNLAYTIINNYNNLLLTQDDSLFQEAIHAISRSDLSALNDPKNPYTIYKKLIDLEKTEVVLPILDREILGKFVKINAKYMCEDADSFLQTKTFDQLPMGVLPTCFQNLFTAMQTRLDALSEGDRDTTLDQVLDHYEISLEFLKQNFVEDAYILQLLSMKGNPTDPAPLELVQLYSLVKYIEDQSDVLEAYKRLTPRESVLLGMSASIRHCDGGKREGIGLAYGMLPDRYKITRIEVDPYEGIRSHIRAEILSLFSTESAFMRVLTNVPRVYQNGVLSPVEQLSHQSIYLKNLIGKRVGLPVRNILFDIHTTTLYDELVSKPLEEVLDIFYEEFNPSFLIGSLKAYMKRSLNSPDVLIKEKVNLQMLSINNELFKGVDVTKFWLIFAADGTLLKEDDLPEEGAVTELSDEGAMEILLKLGYLEAKSSGELP